MEMFLKDMKEVKEAFGKNNSLLDEVLGDMRLMGILNGLGVDEKEISDHLSLLATYLDQRDAEEDPKKTAPYPGMKMTLSLDDSGHLCAIFGLNDEEKKKLLIQANYIYRDFPDEWCSYTTKRFDRERFNILFDSIGNAKKKKLGKAWVFVTGESGTGKSEFLASVTNQLAQKGKSVCFINANERLDALKQMAIKNKEQFDLAMAKIKYCDFLIIDDLGNEYRTEYVRDQILMPILAERSRLSLCTFITSQYSLSELKILYSERGSSVSGKRVAMIIEKNIREEVRLSFGLEGN